MDQCLLVYNAHSSCSEVGGRQGRQGGGVKDFPLPVLVSDADITSAWLDHCRIAGSGLVINDVAVPGWLENRVIRFRDIMENHAVSAYISQDGRSAGVLATMEWKLNNWDLFRTFGKLFFGPAHIVICDIWETEFKAAAALHGKG